MSDIEWGLKPEDVEWTMTWDQKRYPDKPETEQIFEREKALAHLLMNEVLFINSHWWRKDVPEDINKSIAIFVNCNDVFAWGCSDSEDLPFSEIESLYRMWAKDPTWGAAVWCIQRRKQMPQRPVEKIIREAGIWDLDSMGLGPNTLDAEVTAIIQEVAAQRAKSNG